MAIGWNADVPPNGHHNRAVERASSNDNPTGLATGVGEIDIEKLERALQSLTELHPRQANIVELRYFGGLTVAEVADVLSVSERTVADDWRMAKAWLFHALSEGADA